ncbi:TipAS antibiotic-recognition domain-containing protein [Saccharibacillus alkalitolerans]|uniref:TipAS antibiotic-recognition domain-containing protein n=1 Tax=Saccharibacillus alkalitolerans TaxID=2705290 RepID=A0ABX0FAK7_9BACL|nr:TipAS antibiotic-recognition domain-containing protein [Saccharibacillus alkalitolerans]NGZ77972.1 hypothetical protein [Saccharibacillus alkalitolerans]
MLHTLDYTLELTGDGEGEWEPSVLLLLIRSVATEKEQRRWMEEKFPPSLMEKFLPEEGGLDNWRRIEQEAVRWISRLKKLMREGRPPDDTEVQRFVADLTRRLEEGMLSRIGFPLTEAEMADLEAFGRLEPPYSFQLPVMFTAEEERYIERMWEAAAEAESGRTEHEAQPEKENAKNGGDSDRNERDER